MNRFEIIDYLKDAGYNYNFDKYSDHQLYRIYQKSINMVSPKEIASMQREFSNEQPRRTCGVCGADLDSTGDCPVCDHGEEDYFESAIYFESRNSKYVVNPNYILDYDINEFVNNFNKLTDAWEAFIEDEDYLTFNHLYKNIKYSESFLIPQNLKDLLADIYNSGLDFNVDDYVKSETNRYKNGQGGTRNANLIRNNAYEIEESMSELYSAALKAANSLSKTNENYSRNPSLKENNMKRNYDVEEFVERFNDASEVWECEVESDGEYIMFRDINVEEDYFEEIEIPDNLNALLNDVYQRYDYYDVDEHIEMWIDAKRNGVQGVPSVRELVSEAEQIETDLEDLYTNADEVISKMLKESEDEYLEESLANDVDDVEIAIREYFREYGSSVSEEDIIDLSSEVMDYFEQTDTENNYDDVEELVDAFIEEKADETTIRIIRTIRGY